LDIIWQTQILVEKCCIVVRSAFKLQASIEECSLKLADYIPVCLAEQCLQINCTTGKVFGQYVTIGQCCFVEETADVIVGGVSVCTEFGADIRDH
jgi:hypothetical protein